MSGLTPEAQQAIDKAVRIVQEDRMEKFIRQRFATEPPKPTDPPPTDPPVPPTDPKPTDPPPKPTDPPPVPPTDPPVKKKGGYWGELLED